MLSINISKNLKIILSIILFGVIVILFIFMGSSRQQPIIDQSAPKGDHIVRVASWSKWTKFPEPVFTGEKVASDPSIIKDGALYRLFYTCSTGGDSLLGDILSGKSSIRTSLCQAISRDGLSWDHVSDTGKVKGLMIKGREGQWDEDLETGFAFKNGPEYLLFFAGYREEGHPAKGFPASVGLARSTDGRTFSRVSSDPVLSPTPGWYDSDAIHSPTIIRDGDELLMLYAAYCFTTCDKGPSAVIAGATSRDGRQWKKMPTPVFQASRELPWFSDGVAEPGLVKGPDGLYYLFFTGLQGDVGVIGIARSSSLSGPWTINPIPIVTPSSTAGAFDETSTLAPYVLIEGNRVKMWFLGSNKEQRIAIGYAESTWPLYTD